ncbi:MAG: hypothetical protein ACLPW4_16380, partial [Candidatus Sulfotelmatobacter sp.]
GRVLIDNLMYLNQMEDCRVLWDDRVRAATRPAAFIVRQHWQQDKGDDSPPQTHADSNFTPNEK